MTFVKVIDSIVYLATIYDKSEKDDINTKELNISLETLLK